MNRHERRRELKKERRGIPTYNGADWHAIRAELDFSSIGDIDKVRRTLPSLEPKLLQRIHEQEEQIRRNVDSFTRKLSGRTNGNTHKALMMSCEYSGGQRIISNLEFGANYALGKPTGKPTALAFHEAQLGAEQVAYQIALVAGMRDWYKRNFDKNISRIVTDPMTQINFWADVKAIELDGEILFKQDPTGFLFLETLCRKAERSLMTTQETSPIDDALNGVRFEGILLATRVYKEVYAIATRIP